MNKTLNLYEIVSYAFGLMVTAMGLVNTFWGNDPGFGIFLLLLPGVYFLPVNLILQKRFGFTIPKLGVIKFFLALFIIWAALGVGELFDKIDLMRLYFKN
jgi:hypothetical protein